ncbi:unnamed protein product [Peronospora destructor]|uniref:Cleavage/polyadenylation specificity factor A subunit N-terminal domain-containing protein n=1 Tax=Peronospora destructor TaxID=86335 RepID=A0AAV0U8I8_9STRA|nr:unnamed protein product [Peronospora destructor]
MEVERTLVDKDFDRYVLATDGVTKCATALSIEVLAPLDAGASMRKAHWESRVHYNALTIDPFLSQSYGASVAYYVNAEYQLVQVVGDKTTIGVKLENVYNLPVLTTRQENVSIQVAGKGAVVYCDGHGTLYFLKAETEEPGAKWSVVYKCAPWDVIPLLLLGAFYDEQDQHIHIVVAEPLSGNEADRAFRLSLVEVVAIGTATGNDMKIDRQYVGLEHVTSGIAVVTKLPTYVSFCGPEVALLVEGTHQLLLKLVADKEKPTLMKEVSQGSDTLTLHKRRHDEEELDDNETAALLCKLPRAGIGFHGEISKPKEPSELASLDFNTPLSERFQKSSTPFSSVDVPLHGVPDTLTCNRNENIGGGQGRSPEVPTVESILSSFEECDNGDANAKASLLLVNYEQQVVQQQLAIDCLNFQFLCPSVHVNSSSDFKSALLFRSDVHGLVFELNVVIARLSLRHASTLPAFGFVQASKQEKKFMSFHPSGSFACIGEFKRRVFVYQGNSSEKERTLHTRRQHVVELGDQELLGMQIVSERTILVLTSNQVYLLELDI